MQPPPVVGNKPSKSLGHKLGEAALGASVGFGLDILECARKIAGRVRELHEWFFDNSKGS